MSGERFVVIGSNSFSGATFVDSLLREGADVLGMSRSAEPNHVFLPYRWPGVDRPGRFRFAQLDLNHHTDAIADAITEFRPAYVVNFAAQSMVAESWLHPDHWYETNVLANVRLHERLRTMDFLQKYVHVSTPEVYGSCQGLVPEHTNYNPSTPYAASRAACDLHLATYFARYDFPVVFTRAANVFGPGQQLYRIIPRTALFVALRRKLPLHGGGWSVRSFIHMRDVADGTLRVARNGRPGEVYHLSTTRHVAIRDVVQMICEMMGAAFEDVAEITDDRPGKDAAYLLDSTKAKMTLGWSDRVTLEAGIHETIDWTRAHLDVLRTLPSDYVHKR